MLESKVKYDKSRMNHMPAKIDFNKILQSFPHLSSKGQLYIKHNIPYNSSHHGIGLQIRYITVHVHTSPPKLLKQIGRPVLQHKK